MAATNQAIERAHNAALRRFYAKGTRVRDLKTDRTGTIAWYGRDRRRYIRGVGRPLRIGVRWDGADRVVFRGIASIVREDGLTLEDIRARRTTPARVFAIQALDAFREGRTTIGMLDMTDERIERLRRIAREFDTAELAIEEVEPGTDTLLRERESAWCEANRLADIKTKVYGEGRDGIIFIGLDGEARTIRPASANICSA